MENRTPYSVAGYVRLSREDGDKTESDSVGNQKKLILDEIAGREDCTLFDMYVDDGCTGLHFERPSFRRLLADIEKGKVNCVIVKDLSRFGRDYIDSGYYLERYFPAHGVRFISVTDHIDSLGQSYGILLPLKNIFNEQYAKDISEKIHAAVQTRQKAGDFIGAFASYGYKKSREDHNKLVPDEYAAGVVKRIFELYCMGWGKSGIARLLNEEGIACPSLYKRNNGEHYQNSNRLDSTCYWTYSTIDRMLQNELYIGNMVQGRKSQSMRGRARSKKRADWIVVPNTHEAIIDGDTWEKAQDLRRRRARNPDMRTNRGIFAGFLKCGDCGRALVRKAGGSGHGEGTPRYYCGTYVRSGRQYCTPHAISHSVLEGILHRELRDLLRCMDDLEELVAGQEEKCAPERDAWEKEKDRLEAELARVRKLKQAVYEDYRQELLSREEFAAYRKDYVRREELLIKQTDALAKRAAAKDMPGVRDIPWIRYLLKNRDVEKLDRDIVVEMLHEIRVYEGPAVKIIYNYAFPNPAGYVTITHKGEEGKSKRSDRSQRA